MESIIVYQYALDAGNRWVPDCSGTLDDYRDANGHDGDVLAALDDLEGGAGMVDVGFALLVAGPVAMVAK